MTLVKYNPAKFGASSVSRIFDDLLNDRFFNNASHQVGRHFTPSVDVSETDKAFELSFALPGISKDDITVDLKEGTLTVSGERKFENETKEKNFHTVETGYGAFERSFQLPDNIDVDKVDAKYDAGILNVIIPKDEKKIQKKTIAIK